MNCKGFASWFQQPLAGWDCGYESHRGHGCLSHVSVVCCQVEVSVMSWSLVQGSPTDYGASFCVNWKHGSGSHGPYWALRQKTNKQKKISKEAVVIWWRYEPGLCPEGPTKRARKPARQPLVWPRFKLSISRALSLHQSVQCVGTVILFVTTTHYVYLQHIFCLL